MDSLLYARYLPKLSFLHTTSQAQVLSYLSLLQARHYAQGTVDTVVTIIKKFSLSVPEPRQAMLHGNLAQATIQDVDAFIQTASAQGLSPATINTALSLLKAFFDFLHEDGQMPHQPILRHRHRLVAPATLPKPMPEADLLQFFTVIDAVRDRLIFLLMLRCGLRVSEVSHLTWEDIDVHAKTLRINNSKGQVDRVVYLAPDVEQSLTRWRSRRSAPPYVFPGREKGTTPLSRKQIFWLMKKYLRWAKLPRQYSPHWLRHTFATQLLNAGVSLEVLKELMGHRSIHITLRYTKLYDATKRHQYDQAMEKIEKRQAGFGR
jgi:site-specific recombinase XerD